MSELVVAGVSSYAEPCLSGRKWAHTWGLINFQQMFISLFKITRSQNVSHNKPELDCFSSLQSFPFVSVFATKCLSFYPLLHPSPSPLVMSVSRSVWSFCYHYCGPLWPNPHIYKASQKTRMMIVIGHPQDTVQCLGDCVSCVSLHLALHFSSPLC